MGCHCIDVDFGTYANTIQLVAPFPLYDILGDEKDTRVVVIDTCIATEIGYLWHQGVRTENSCCGHRKMRPTVVVAPGSVLKMRELGYKNAQENFARPNETFYLKEIVALE